MSFRNFSLISSVSGTVNLGSPFDRNPFDLEPGVACRNPCLLRISVIWTIVFPLQSASSVNGEAY